MNFATLLHPPILGYAEWDAQRKGTSYKQKLKIAIDRLIPIFTDLDDLLRRLEADGYEIKRGKYISFRAPGQERFTRAKTLGEAYTEEVIAKPSFPTKPFWSITA